MTPNGLYVSILIRPSGRMQPAFTAALTLGKRIVSILIRPEGRMQLNQCATLIPSLRVSILIRPEGRMQRAGLPQARLSPTSFNPHPARRPDATGVRRHRLFAFLRSFQSSSGQKAGCNRWWQETWINHSSVSILIRPDATPDATRARPPRTGACSGFNPHPARRPDATAAPAQAEDARDVSILIRPEGRMQRLYLNFLSVLREPPDTGLPICFHCPDHFFPPATIQLRTRTSRLQWFRHGVRVRPPGVP